jgi:hypothetical protein
MKKKYLEWRALDDAVESLALNIKKSGIELSTNPCANSSDTETQALSNFSRYCCRVISNRLANQEICNRMSPSKDSEINMAITGKDLFIPTNIIGWLVVLKFLFAF